MKRRTRTAACLLLVLCLVWMLPGCTGDAEENGAAQPPPAADDTTSLAMVAEEDFALSAYDGEVVLLNFWATWCAPCRAEIPDLIALQEDFGAEGLQIIGVAMDMEGAEVVRPYAEEMAINYPIVIDPQGTIAEEYGGVMGLPTTLVIDREGTVTERILGLFPTERMRPQIDALLDGSTGT